MTRRERIVHQKNCSYCNQAFETGLKTQIFCCGECAKQALYKKSRDFNEHFSETAIQRIFKKYVIDRLECALCRSRKNIVEFRLSEITNDYKILYPGSWLAICRKCKEVIDEKSE